MTQADLLQNLHRICQREWSNAAREIGLSLSEFEYLKAVDDQAHLPQTDDAHGGHLSDIVDALGVTKASASAMINKLETRGWVERFQCKMDARAQHITLTPPGKQHMLKGRELYKKIARIARQEIGLTGFSITQPED